MDIAMRQRGARYTALEPDGRGERRVVSAVTVRWSRHREPADDAPRFALFAPSPIRLMTATGLHIMRMHALVEDVVGTYLDAVDAEISGFVEGLYLTGSVALHDFQPHTSDVDFVAVTAARPDPQAARALARAHARLTRRWRRPVMDGIYLTWDDLAREPALSRGCARCHDGRFLVGEASGDPSTWHTLAGHGIACRGPERGDVPIWTDPAVLRAWTLSHLDRYWGRLLDRAAQPVSIAGAAALTPYMTAWIVLGVTRLHYTLGTGDICSKQHAGYYARQVFSERWHRVVDEALRIRLADDAVMDLVGALAGFREFVRVRRATCRGPRFRTPFERRRDVIAYGNMVIADAKRLAAAARASAEER